MTQAVLLNSGGIDSRVCAAIGVAAGLELRSLFIDWIPEVSEVAGRAAQQTAERYCASHEVFRFPLTWSSFFPQLGKNSMPYTGLLAVSLGASYARYLKADYVLSGLRDEGRPSEDWPTDVQRLLAGATFVEPVVLSVPLYRMTAHEVAVRALELAVDLSGTYSCGTYPACGTCKSCLRRVDM